MGVKRGSRKACSMADLPQNIKNHPSTATCVCPAALPVSPAEESWVFERDKQNHGWFPVAAWFYSKVSVLLLASAGLCKTVMKNNFDLQIKKTSCIY